MFTLIAMGSPMFWAVVLIWFTVTAFLSDDHPGSAFCATLVMFSVLWVLGGINLPALLIFNPVVMIFALPAYIAAGLVWSLCKWKFYIMGQRRKIEEVINEANEYYGARPEEKVNRSRFIHAGLTKAGMDFPITAPKPGQHKTRIVSWMIWWPLSLVWTMLDDPLRRAFMALYERFSGLFQKISDHEFRNFPTVNTKNSVQNQPDF